MELPVVFMGRGGFASCVAKCSKVLVLGRDVFVRGRVTESALSQVFKPKNNHDTAAPFWGLKTRWCLQRVGLFQPQPHHISDTISLMSCARIVGTPAYEGQNQILAAQGLS